MMPGISAVDLDGHCGFSVRERACHVSLTWKLETKYKYAWVTCWHNYLSAKGQQKVVPEFLLLLFFLFIYFFLPFFSSSSFFVVGNNFGGTQFHCGHV